MGKDLIVGEIKRLTGLMNNSTKEKKEVLEGRLVRLYNDLYNLDPELKDTKKIDERINKTKVERSTNWALKVRALEELKNDVDVVVTLLDGTSIRKSQVPAGEIYINEKGQKCRKVLKVVSMAKPPIQSEKKDQKFLGGLAQKIGTGVANGSNQLIKVTKKTFGKIGEKRRKAKESATALMDVMVAKLMAKMKIGDTIRSLEEYQTTSGKDVSDLINFLKKLQTVG